MSNVIGAKTEEGYLMIASLGSLSIETTPMRDKQGIFNLDIGAANRMEALHMETAPGETVDQFCQRLKGMLRALWSGERMPANLDEKKPDVKSGKDKVEEKVGRVAK